MGSRWVGGGAEATAVGGGLTTRSKGEISAVDLVELEKQVPIVWCRKRNLESRFDEDDETEREREREDESGVSCKKLRVRREMRGEFVEKKKVSRHYQIAKSLGT